MDAQTARQMQINAQVVFSMSTPNQTFLPTQRAALLYFQYRLNHAITDEHS